MTALFLIILALFVVLADTPRARMLLAVAMLLLALVEGWR